MRQEDEECGGDLDGRWGGRILELGRAEGLSPLQRYHALATIDGGRTPWTQITDTPHFQRASPVLVTYYLGCGWA